MEVKVFDQDTTELGKSDRNGYFNIELPKNSKNLIFSGVGLEWTNVAIPTGCENIEIILLTHAIYDFMSPKKIDRLRKKRFDKISELHSKAFINGLFKSDKPCFKRVFEPIKEELDKIVLRSRKIAKENKKNFELLKVGDTIIIPFSGTYKYDGTERTSLFPYSYIVESENFDCKIKGVVIEKKKNRKDYFLTFKVTNTNDCEFKSIVYDEKALEIGQIIEYNMKYCKVIIE